MECTANAGNEKTIEKTKHSKFVALSSFMHSIVESVRFFSAFFFVCFAIIDEWQNRHLMNSLQRNMLTFIIHYLLNENFPLVRQATWKMFQNIQFYLPNWSVSVGQLTNWQNLLALIYYVLWKKSNQFVIKWKKRRYHQMKTFLQIVSKIHTSVKVTKKKKKKLKTFAMCYTLNFPHALL